MRSPKCSWDRFLKNRNVILDPRDMISRMPENVLHHIVSFLQNRDQSRYKFLSRKWRQLAAQNQKALSLTGRKLNEEQLSKILMVDFHSLEFLHLIRCFGMKTMKLMSYNIKTLVLTYCRSLHNLQLNMPRLETFRFHGHCSSPCSIEFGICKQLKYVQLVGVKIDNMRFMDCNKSFPHLKVLIIGCCDFVGCVNISSTSLEKLSLFKFRKSAEFNIDTPNLVEFKYSGSTTLAISNMNCPNLLSAETKFYTSRDQKFDDMWFHGLHDMIWWLDHSKKVKIRSNSDKSVIIPNKIRETYLVHPLDGVDNLVLDLDSKATNVKDLVDSMLWLAPRVRYFDLFTLSGNAQVQLFHSETSIIDEKPCKFCASYSSRCWRHLLKMIQYDSDNETGMKMFDYLEENINYVNNGPVTVIVEV